MNRKGFTMVELIVVVGIMLVMGAIVVANFAGKRSSTDLTDASAQISALLRQAQGDSVTQKNGYAWGVHFANTTATPAYYAIFYTSSSMTFSPSNIAAQYPLPGSVAYVTSSIASGGTLDIMFNGISGAASVSTSVKLYLPKQNAALSSTIMVASSGLVIY